ncbi:MAG: hypothetical protein Q8P91_02720 [bacterium]|nr:hypothetical protein [bacterium]
MEPKPKNSRKITFGLFALFILILLVLLGVYLVKQRSTIIPRAYGPGGDAAADLANSYIFVSPLQALAGGEKIRVNIFILDNSGRGLSGKTVAIGNTSVLKVDAIQSKSDEIGKAVFDISSITPGVFLIEASVDGAILPQRVNVTFK